MLFSDISSRLKSLLYILGLSGLPLSKFMSKHIENIHSTNKGNNLDINGFFPGNKMGAFCISIDVELSWGKRFSSDSYFKRLIGCMTRKNFPAILDMLNHERCPATWAVVGHLMLDHCSKINRIPHPDIIRQPYHKNDYWNYHKGDWYNGDPCTNLQKASSWYAPDLITKICSSSINHEIGTHTFSHIDMSDKNCPSAVAATEIKKCKELSKNYGQSLKSIVFPANIEGNFKILHEHGINSFRGYNKINSIGFPIKKNELWDIHSSMQIKLSGRVKQDKIYAFNLIDQVIQYGGVFHIWFHLFEINKIVLEQVLHPIVCYAQQKSEDGLLWIATMNEIAQHCERQKKTIKR